MVPVHNDKANMLNSFFSQCFNTKLPPLTPSDSHRLTTSDECPESILCSEEEIRPHTPIPKYWCI